MAIVASGVFMATLDASIVNVSLPTLVRELDAPFDRVQWVTLAYVIAITGLLLPSGRLAQMRGAKRLYLFGFLVFTIGSLLCGLASNVGLLIAFRVVQGVGGSMTQALGPALVVDAFPPSERGRAIGFILSAVSIGLVSGPVLGGLILGSLGWPFIFLLNVPVGIAAVALGARILPAGMPGTGGRFDLRGAALLMIGLIFLVVGLNRIQTLAITSPAVIALIVAGLTMLLGFAWWQTRTRWPTIEPGMFRVPDFTAATLAGYLTFAGAATQILLLPFYLQRVLDLPVQQVGLLMVTVPALMGLLGTPSGILADRTSSRTVGALGIGLVAIGLALLTTLSSDTSPWAVVPRLAVIGVGMAMFNSGNASMLMGSAASEHRNQASAVLALARNMAQATGQALWGTIWATIVVLQLGVDGPDVAAGPDTVGAFRIVFGAAGVVVVLGVLVTLAPLLGTQEAR
jgi:EmrB/QacA subfamily drug resistance transporter